MSDTIEGQDLDILNDGAEEIPEEETIEESEELEEKPEEESELDESEESEESEDKESKEETPTEEKEDKETKLSSGNFRRPTVKEITEKYPGLFKDFPQVKEALFREKQFNEEFNSIADAKEAKSKAETFDFINEDINTGNTLRLLSSIKESSPNGFKKFTENFLPHLFKTDEGAYFRTITPLMKNFVRSMYSEGKKLNNENISSAALVALEYLGFEESDLQGEKRIPKEIEDKEREISDREKNFNHQRYQEAYEQVSSNVKSELDSLISELTKNDKGSSYELKKYREDIFATLNKYMGSDKKNNDEMTSYWKRAEKAGFNREWRDRISNAYLSRAKAILPAIRNKVRKEVFGQTTSKKIEESKKQVVQKKSTTQITSPPNKRFKSDLDILNED